MKKLLLALIAILILNVPGRESVAEAPKYHWKIGHVRGTGSAIDEDTKWLVKKITDDSQGRITFDIYPASKLGDYTVVQESCAFGDVEMYIAPFGTITDKRLALPFTPYLVKNWTEAKRVYAPESVMMKQVASYLEKQNIQLLAGWPVYFGGIVLTKEPLSPADPDVPKNLTIRVPPIRSFELTAQALGYKPYPITWMYARSGLTTGMVNGILGGGAEGYIGLKDLARYYLAVKDHFEYWFIYMNLDLWKGLSDEDQAIIQNAAREMEIRRFEIAETDEQENIKRLADQGTKIITFTDEELEKMAQKIRQYVWPTLRKDIGPAFDDVVSSVQE